jgi:hypothetical protein
MRGSWQLANYFLFTAITKNFLFTAIKTGSNAPAGTFLRMVKRETGAVRGSGG